MLLAASNGVITPLEAAAFQKSLSYNRFFCASIGCC